MIELSKNFCYSIQSVIDECEKLRIKICPIYFRYSGYKKIENFSENELILKYSDHLIKYVLLKKIYYQGIHVSLKSRGIWYNNLNKYFLAQDCNEFYNLIIWIYVLSHMYAKKNIVNLLDLIVKLQSSYELFSHWIENVFMNIKDKNFKWSNQEKIIFINKIKLIFSEFKNISLIKNSNNINTIVLNNSITNKSVFLLVINDFFISMKVLYDNELVTNYVLKNIVEINRHPQLKRNNFTIFLKKNINIKISDEQLNVLLFATYKFRSFSDPLEDSKFSGFNVHAPQKLTLSELNQSDNYRFVIKKNGEIIFGYDNAIIISDGVKKNLHYRQKTYYSVCSHAALSDFEDVVAAGKVYYDSVQRKILLMYNHSGHFWPDEASLYLSYIIFRKKFGDSICNKIKFQYKEYQLINKANNVDKVIVNESYCYTL